jgi:hypothetical protein
MNAADFLADHSAEILANALDSMKRAHLAHYEKSGEAGTRLGVLLELVVAATRERRLAPVLEHAERIARERHAAGYPIGEVQTAINVLEEAVWRSVLAEVPAAEQADVLGLVATVLGATKDRLASTYVTLVSKKTTSTLHVEDLFKGTQNTGGGSAT